MQALNIDSEPKIKRIRVNKSENDQESKFAQRLATLDCKEFLLFFMYKYFF